MDMAQVVQEKSVDEIHRRFMGKRNTRIGKVQSALANSERNKSS